MLPILIQHLPRDRERMGLRPVQMAGRLGLTLTEYRALEAGELYIDYDLYLRITDLCGWPRDRPGKVELWWTSNSLLLTQWTGRGRTSETERPAARIAGGPTLSGRRREVDDG